jgi:two-component system, NarL family, invasion response regulator UvrY
LNVGEGTTAIQELEAKTPLRALAVDDSAEFRSALRRIVERTSTLVLVAEAASGEAAVNVVRQQKPDLVLMDVRMPGVGGISAAGAIKQIRPQTIVLLISSTPPDELPAEAQTCLADAIVWKGALTSALFDEIWNWHAARRAATP